MATDPAAETFSGQRIGAARQRPGPPIGCGRHRDGSKTPLEHALSEFAGDFAARLFQALAMSSWPGHECTEAA